MKLNRRQGLALMSAAALAPGAALASGSYDVAVIGAGVFGAWIAERLKKAGASVALVDQFGVGHARASSGGETRVTRYSYGGDPLYTEMARESLIAWKEISARAATPIFHNAGVLWFSPAGDDYMAKSVAYFEKTGVKHRRMDRAALSGAYPQMRFFDGEAGFLEEETGALVAGRGVQTVVALNGIPVTFAEAAAPKKKNGAFAPAPGVSAKTLVYALGPWLPRLFPQFLGGKIAATRQEVLHFGPAPGDERFAPPRLPVWADFNAGDLVYGIPDIEGQGFKFCFGGVGPEIDPDTENRLVDPQTVARAREYLARRFPDLKDAPLVHSRVCQYENSWNSDLVLDRHPEIENVWIAGGGSGHGFKLGPSVGRYVADRIADPKLPAEPRFALGAMKTVTERLFR
ncbi:MAG: FAD-dependent oxidoreductase [Parvularculaceae bacterium]